MSSSQPPAWVRNFAEGGGLQAETDRKDAELLALYAERERPAPRPRADTETVALQALVTRREQLLEILVADEHRLQRAFPELRKEVRHHISYLKCRLKDLDDELYKTLRRSEA